MLTTEAQSAPRGPHFLQSGDTDWREILKNTVASVISEALW